MQIYTDYISSKTFRLLHNMHNVQLNEHILSPLGVNTPLNRKEIAEWLERLKELYLDGRELRTSLDSNLILYDLIKHYYFEHEELIRMYGLNTEASDYYELTKQEALKIPNAKEIRKNHLYEIVIRNLLILGENISKSRDVVSLESIDVSLSAVELLCHSQIRDLFKFDEYEYTLNSVDEMVQFTKEHGGFPFQFTHFVDDPKEKNKLKNFIFGTPQIKANVEIHLYDCNFAHLLYAVLLTALAFKLEVMSNGRIYGTS